MLKDFYHIQIREGFWKYKYGNWDLLSTVDKFNARVEVYNQFEQFLSGNYKGMMTDENVSITLIKGKKVPYKPSSPGLRKR